MKEEGFFDRLLLLPLFQGIGRGDFQEIAERVRLGFLKKAKGNVLARQDELCTGLYFVLGGEICASKLSDQNDYALNEWLNMPLVLQPECLFGLSTRYTRTFIAASDVQLLRVEKDVVRDVLFYYPTFRINYLNLLSTRAQLSSRLLWRNVSMDLRSRFVQFLSARCLRPAGRKELQMGMVPLAEELLTTRLKVSRMLNDLADQNLLELHREKIVVPNMERLLM